MRSYPGINGSTSFGHIVTTASEGIGRKISMSCSACISCRTGSISPMKGMEEAIYDSYAMRSFLGINFIDERVSDATTLLKLRHLLEQYRIGEKIFRDVNDRLEKAGLMMHGGSIVDATIVAAPSSTRNKDGKRDPEMHQTKKGNQ